MNEELPPFPVDDVTLDALEHAMGGAFTVDPDGTHRLVGADMSVSQLLDFLSGYDPEKVIPYEGEDGHTHDEISEYVGGQIYTRDCVIRALIDEVRRLRHATERAAKIGEEVGAHLVGRVQTGHASSKFNNEPVVTMTLWAHDIDHPGEFAMFPDQARVLADALRDSADRTDEDEGSTEEDG